MVSTPNRAAISDWEVRLIAAPPHAMHTQGPLNTDLHSRINAYDWGSGAYSWLEGTYHFIMLHGHPDFRSTAWRNARCVCTSHAALVQ
jgi:hypothetical protein